MSANIKILSSTDILARAEQLSDEDLLARTKALVQREREATAVLVGHLAVLDERESYRAEGYSSLFTYCTQALHLSENEAYWRIEAARAARKFPMILDLLAEGSVHLTAVVLLAPDLTEENHRELLSAATHKSKREVKEMVVALRPQPPVPGSIRRLPTPSLAGDGAPDAQTMAPTAGIEGVLDLASLMATAPQRPQASPSTAIPAGGIPVGAAPASSPSRRGTIEPLAPQRYRVQFTASAELYAKLRQAQDLLRHQIPDGNLEQVMDRALTALLEQLTRRKFAATARPRNKGLGSNVAGRSKDRKVRQNSKESESRANRSESDRIRGPRSIPAEVRRMVSERDGWQCAFVSDTGHRCTERGLLEFHHVVPYSLGGQATMENIQLRCRAHNGFEAERYFGRPLLKKRRAQARTPRRADDCSGEPGVKESSPEAYLAKGAFAVPSDQLWLAKVNFEESSFKMPWSLANPMGSLPTSAAGPRSGTLGRLRMNLR